MTIVLPGYVPDQTALTSKATAAWANAMRDRGLQIFTTAGARDTAITSPQVGQVSVITTGTAAGVYEYVGPTDGWVPPWTTAWGLQSQALVTANVLGITGTLTFISGYHVTISPYPANRNIEVRTHVPWWEDNGSGLAKATVLDVTNASDQIGYVLNKNTAANDRGQINASLPYITTGAVLEFKLSGESSSGNIDFKASAAGSDPGQGVFSIVDCGPAGAPS